MRDRPTQKQSEGESEKEIGYRNAPNLKIIKVKLSANFVQFKKNIARLKGRSYKIVMKVQSLGFFWKGKKQY